MKSKLELKIKKRALHEAIKKQQKLCAQFYHSQIAQCDSPDKITAVKENINKDRSIMSMKAHRNLMSCARAKIISTTG